MLEVSRRILLQRADSLRKLFLLFVFLRLQFRQTGGVEQAADLGEETRSLSRVGAQAEELKLVADLGDAFQQQANHADEGFGLARGNAVAQHQ